MNEGAEHGEEAASGAVNGRGVVAVVVDAAVAGEEVVAWDSHVGEGEAAVVDSVKPTFEAVIF